MICFINIVNLSLANIKTFYNCIIHAGVRPAQVLKNLEGLKVDTVSLSKLPRKVKIQHYALHETVPQEKEVLVIKENTGRVFKRVTNPKTGKIEKIPSEVYVAHSFDGCFDRFHFLEKGTDKEIGYAKFFNTKRIEENKKLLDYYQNTFFSRNYKGYGLSNDRLIIEEVYNNNEQAYGGIGELADRLAVEVCLKCGIKPRSIISQASFNSHAQHYKRGCRFIRTGNDDVNKIVAQRIKETPLGEKTDTEDLGDILMYRPKSLIIRYEEEIKKHPSLNIY